MSDTPRTDAAMWACGSLSVKVDFARQLEREVDTATEELDNAYAVIMGLKYELAEAAERNGNLCVELAAMRQSRNAADDEATRLCIELAAVKKDNEALRREVEEMARLLSPMTDCGRHVYQDGMFFIGSSMQWVYEVRDALRKSAKAGKDGGK